MRVALTGGTGFVGGHVMRCLQAAGHEIVALTRRSMRARDHVRWVLGDLADRGALAALVEGADSVIHVAGVLNARDAAGFTHGNVDGTATLLKAAEQAEVTRFVHVSSLAGREPGLSLYGASKAESETLVWASTIASAIVRPPAVYGPGDRETLDLFRMARRHLMLMPPHGRLSLIHVEDLARLLARLADVDAPVDHTYEPDDGHPGGYSHRDFARLLGQALNRRVFTLNMPRALLSLAAKVDRLLRGDAAKLTPDRVAYFVHPDWVCRPALAPPPELWQPRIATPEGLTLTARWYKAEDWL